MNELLDRLNNLRTKVRAALYGLETVARGLAVSKEELERLLEIIERSIAVTQQRSIAKETVNINQSLRSEAAIKSDLTKGDRIRQELTQASEDIVKSICDRIDDDLISVDMDFEDEF